MKKKTINLFLNKLTHALFCFLMLIALNEAIAQSKSNPVRIKWGSFEGYACYEYIMEGKDTILDGEFEFNGPILDTFSLVQNTYFSINGFFSNNQPVDHWLFSTAYILNLNKTTFNDTYIKVYTKARKHDIAGSFDDDHNGAYWEHKVTQVENGENIGYDFILELEPQKKKEGKVVKIKVPGYELKGSANEYNFANGLWDVTSNNDTANIQWVFRNGILSKVSNGGLNWIIDGKQEVSNAAKMNTFKLSNEYIEILKLKLAISNYQNEDTEVVSMLSALDSLEDVRYQFFQTLKENYTPLLKFKLPYYPLSKTEEVTLDSVLVLYNSMDSIFLKIQGINDVDLFKKNFPDVANLLDSVDLYYSNEFIALKQIRTLYKEDLIAYLNRDKLVDYLVNGVNSADSTRSNTRISLSDYLNKIKANHIKLHDLKERIISLNDMRKKEKTLLALERKMIEKDEVFNITIDSLLIETPPEFKNAVNAIQTLRDSLLQEYWNVNTVVEKLIIAEENITCLDHLLMLTNVIYRQSEKETEIIKLYTESDFNVFTSTDIQYISKKRIVEAYQEILVPYFYQLILDTVSCTNAVKIKDLMHKTSQRMLELKHEDTKGIEKKLNKQCSAQEVLRLFDVKEQ